MRKTYLEWVEIVNNLAYDEVLVDMLSDWQADGLFRTDCINKLEARIAELSQALGLITTLKPTMVMDTDHPLDMAKEVAEYVNARIAELEAAQRWIPVSERLPEPYTRVLACIKSGYMEVDYMYSEPIVDVGIADFNSLDNVTHWMPLPPSPESEVK